jgi:hypothetical protein
MSVINDKGKEEMRIINDKEENGLPKMAERQR